MQAGSQTQLLGVLCPMAPRRGLAPGALAVAGPCAKAPSIHRSSVWVSEAMSSTMPTELPSVPRGPRGQSVNRAPVVGGGQVACVLQLLAFPARGAKTQRGYMGPLPGAQQPHL